MRNLGNCRNIHQFPTWLENMKPAQLAVANENGASEIDEIGFKGEKIRIADADDDYYGEEEHEIRYLLRRAFYNKCVYCEREELKPDVEHFRPKGRVTGKGGNNHGYFWLCYNWSNLLPSCADCNRFSGKLDKFPVSGKRVVKPPFINNTQLDFQKCSVDSAEMISENAYLLNPEVDQPELHLKVEWNGKLTGLDKRGVETIAICDLNRANLIRARKKIVYAYVKSIYAFFYKFRDNTINALALQDFLGDVKRDCAEMGRPENAFSLVYYTIISHWSEFVEELFPELDDVEKQVLKIVAY